MRVPADLSAISLPACLPALNGRHPGRDGCTRSNTTASASWPGVIAKLRLYTRNGYDFAGRFPQIVEAVSKLKARSCFIDGEAVVVDECGLSTFDLLRSWRHDHAAVLCAFDLIELDGEDLRRSPIEHRKCKLAKLVRGPHPGIAPNEHYEGDGAIVFKYACKLGCEGIVSKRRGSQYRSGRSAHWVKVKNPNAPAVKREAEEDWGSPHWIKNRKRKAVTRGEY
jgi:bifunctional non-homologous end joining protein LigD